MPKITRWRIVGLSYDDGKSGYSDMIFDLTETDGRTPAKDAVYTIKNGVGKTVLTQVMLQPLKPNTAIAERRFKEFFPKPKDKAFILIEYRKDNSEEFVTIGLAVRAKTRSKTSDDDTVNEGIDYYSFITEYKSPDDPESLSSLPLSRVEDNKIFISPYDCVESLAKQNGSNILIIKNDLDRLRSTLRNFGISPDEVDLMAKINQEEGGVPNYFEKKAKTSDQLIRELMIPAIETAMKKGIPSQESGRNPINEAFFEIARSQSKKMEDSKKRAAVERFMGPFNVFRDLVSDLEASGERRSEAAADYIALSNQLDAFEYRFEKEIEDCDKAIEDLERDKDRIAHEEASFNYYNAEDAFNESEEEYIRISETKSALEADNKDYSHEMDVLVCADKYAELCGAEEERNAVLEMIKEKEKGTDSYEQLDQISYTIYMKAEELLTETENRLEDECTKRDEEKAALDTASEEYANMSRESKKISSEKERKRGEYDTHCKMDDKLAAKISDSLRRKLDGKYNKTEIKNSLTNAENCKIDTIKRIDSLKDELYAKQQRQTAIPYEREREYKNNAENEKALEKINEEISRYNEIKQAAAAIACEYGYGLTRASEAGVVDAVNRDIYSCEATKATLSRESILLQVEAEAVEKGSLHVAESVRHFLDNKVDDYEIAEALLLDLISSGKIERSEAEAILEANPLLAYAIIVPSGKVRDDILESSDGWVSTVVPIFTRAEFASAFEGEKICSDGMLARYDKGYFHDPAKFADNLCSKKEKKATAISELDSRMSEMETSLECLFSFYDFEDGWLDSKLNEKEEVRNRIELSETKLKELQAEEESCIKLIKDISAELKAKESERRDAEDVIIAAKNLLKAISSEENLYKQVVELEERAEELREAADNAADAMARHEKEYKRLTAVVSELESVKNECEGHIGSVTWNNEHPLLEQSIESLVKWRDDILRKQEADMQRLQGRLDNANKMVDFFRGELQRISSAVTKEEYMSTAPSKKRQEELSELLRSVASKLDETEKILEGARNRKADANAKLGVALDALAEWGKRPLSKSSIGTDFAKRMKDVRKKQKGLESGRRTAEKNKGKAGNLKYRIKGDIAGADTSGSSNYTLEDFAEADSAFEALSRKYKNARAAYAEALKITGKSIKKLKAEHSEISTIADYITQCERDLPDIESGADDIGSYRRSIDVASERLKEWHVYLEESLKDIEEEKERYISECAKLARKYREGIEIIGKKTKVRLDEKREVRMLRINLPSVGSEEEGRRRMSIALNAAIDECAAELAELNDLSELSPASKKRYEQVVSGFGLVTAYLGIDSSGIRIDAYKLAEDSHGGDYYRWEQKARFSGGQRFALYLAVILALLHYTRRSYNLDDFDDSLSFSLILDNPFGTMSSQHLIKPVFSMARKLDAQLICLTDIRNSGVLNQFDVRYELRLENKVSKKALMEAKRYYGMNLFSDDDSSIEEAHFKSEQLSLLG